MNKHEFIIKLSEAIQSEASDRRGRLSDLCSLYTPDDFDQYHSMDEKERRQLEEHARRCPVCGEHLSAVKAQHDEIIERYDIIDMVAEAEKIWHAKTRSHRQQLWAAAGKHGECPGQSYGLIVSRERRIGKVVKCDAWVGEQVDRDDPLAIYGREKLSTADGESYTSALANLKRKLQHQFRTNPLLKKAHLIRRYVRVDIGEDILDEAESLTLAVLMAIVARIRPALMQEPIAYSADLGLDGNLEAVRHIEHKVQAAIDAGIRTIVLASAVKKVCPNALLNDDRIELLFFNDLASLFSHFQLSLSEIDAKNVRQELNLPDAAIPVDDEDHAKEIILGACMAEGLSRETVRRLMRLFEDLCQIPAAQESFGTVIFVGDPVRINAILPVSGIDLKGEGLPLAHPAPLLELARIVDGVSYCLVADREARVVGVRGVDVEFSKMAGASPLLFGLSQRYGILSHLTRAMIWHFPAPGRSLIVHRDGQPLGRYIGGRWRLCHPAGFWELLQPEFRKRQIRPRVALTILQVALQMSERGLGGTMVLEARNDGMKDLLEIRLDPVLSLVPDRLVVEELTHDELLCFARQDGAVVIDNEGRLVACRAYFKYPAPDPPVPPFISTRHRHASCFSRAIVGLVVVASRDGTVTVYGDGEMLARY